ncbi:MAG: murein L,D-transpeptidase [Bacteroidetes bacterium]|nr:MAG: murein L,D-transpeptidase [Bacteroidota bacterium]
MNFNIKFLILIPIVFLLSVCLMTPGLVRNDNFEINTKYIGTPLIPSYPVAKDTIFILSDYYIILSLKHQNVEIVFRNDSCVSFNISSGTSRLEKGKDTPTGIYTVQSKSPVAISKQFENAELINWIGFNGNIGFHGLNGNKYYWRLGKAPSSHGCIRISREDGAKLYSVVKRGTPIMVVDNEPARIFAFANPSDYDPNTDILLNKNGSYQSKILNKRLDYLYKGKSQEINFGKVILDGNTVLKPGGYSIGEANRITITTLPHIIDRFEYTKKDISIINKYVYFNKKDSLAKSIYKDARNHQHNVQ